MPTETILSVCAFALLSLADLRYRTVPAIEVFFLGVLLLAIPANPINSFLVVLAVFWGLIRSWPGVLVWPMLFVPSAWPVLLIGYGVRVGVVGRADLLAAGALAVLFPWPALIFSFVGLELWRRWWTSRRAGLVPALPGMFLGLSVYLLGMVISGYGG